MSIGMPYPRVGNPYTQLDPSAKNPLGAITAIPWGSAPAGGSQIFSTTPGQSTPGYGAPPVLKYVYYNSTLNPAPVTAPAPVYWLDESFTQITGAAEEAYNPVVGSANGAAIAGYLLPNTVSYSGLTASILNQSYCWIQVGGFLPGAFEPSTQTSTTFSNPIYGLGSGNWTSGVNTSVPNSVRAVGCIWSAVAGGVCDVLVNGWNDTFWGS
jgi:hypothetical protein